MITTLSWSLVLASICLAYVPGPERYETKWLMPLCEPARVAAESSHTYDVRFYRIDLNLPMTSGAMSARCGIWLVSQLPLLDSVVFDFGRLVCDSVRRTGQTQNFRTTTSSLIVYLAPPLALGESVYLDIYYRRLSTTTNRGFYYYLQGSGSGRNHSVCYTLTQPEDARYWFPCWDHPWDKAERGCQVNITVPDSFRACANGMLDSVTSGPARTKTFWWTHRYPIPTYLINFAVSIFKEITQWYRSRSGDSMLIRHWVWPEDSIRAMTAFANVPDMIAFYSDSNRFGEYPFLAEKYGQVAVYPFGAGGMEHQTMTTIHRSWITNADESGIAHELAHMWYGDCITCFIWAEIWLNEGGASYLDPLWHYHRYGRQAFLNAMEEYRQDFFTADARDRHPIYNPGMSRLFDWGHTYCKSAWVNHMARYVMGDTVFEQPGIWFQAEREWLDSFAYGNSTTEDRKRIQERVSGLELDWFYDEWVYMAGFPYYNINWFRRQTAEGWQLIVDVAQSNGNQAPVCFHIPLEARVTLADGTDTLLHWNIRTNPQRDTFLLPDQPTGFEFNPGRWILEKHNITTGIENQIMPEAEVGRATLFPLRPNPARNKAQAKIGLTRPGPFQLRLYDATGRCIRSYGLTTDKCNLTVPLELYGLPDGIYLVRLDVGNITSTQKLIVQNSN